VRFNSIKEAERFGININKLKNVDTSKEKKKKKKNKREEIVKLLNNIKSSSYEFEEKDEDSYVLTIDGFAAPSWNKMIRLNYRMYGSYSKALKGMIVDAGFRAKVLKKYKAFKPDEPVSVNIHCERRYLLDLDNVCAKQIIDGVVACGILTDDKPQYIQAYQATQEKSKKDRTILTLTKI